MWQRDASALDLDVDAYLEIANHVASGSGFLREQTPHPTAYRPPLYPLLIAGIYALGGSNWTLGGIQVLLGTFTVFFTFRCAELLKLGRFSVVAAGLVAVDPLLIRYTTLPMTESVCTFLVMTWCWLILEFPATAPQGLPAASTGPLWRYLRSIMHGAILGLICLCRPAFLAVVVLAAAWNLYKVTELILSSKHPSFSPKRWTIEVQQLLRVTLFSVVGLLLVLTPWVVRNALVMGKPIAATTHGGYTILLANNAVFYNEVLDGPRGAVWSRNSLLDWQASLERELEQAGIARTDEVARDAWMSQRAIQFIRRNPFRFVRACLYRFGCFWSVAPSSKAQGIGVTMTRMIAVFYGLVTLGLLIGLFRFNWTEWSNWLPLLSLPLTLCFTHLVYWTDTRMRAPVIPIIALVAARSLITKPLQHSSGQHQRTDEPSIET